MVTVPGFLPQPCIILLLTSLLKIGTRILSSWLFWVSIISHLVGKHCTLTYITSCMYVQLSGHSSFQYQANSSPIACALIVLGSWNCCSGEQGLAAQHPLLSVCPYGSIELEAVGFSIVCHLFAGEFT